MADTDTVDHGGGGGVEEPEADSSAEDMNEVEAMAEAIAVEDERRKWIRTLAGLIDKEIPEAGHNEQVANAWNLTRIAAFEAIRRVLSGSLPGEVSLD